MWGVSAQDSYIRSRTNVYSAKLSSPILRTKIQSQDSQIGLGGGINFYTAMLFPHFLWVMCLEGIKMYAPLQSDPSWQKAEQSGIERDVHKPIALPCAQPGTWWQYNHPAWHTRLVHSTANTCVLPGTPLGAAGKPVRAINSFNKQHAFVHTYELCITFRILRGNGEDEETVKKCLG